VGDRVAPDKWFDENRSNPGPKNMHGPGAKRYCSPDSRQYQEPSAKSHSGMRPTMALRTTP